VADLSGTAGGHIGWSSTRARASGGCGRAARSWYVERGPSGDRRGVSSHRWCSLISGHGRWGPCARPPWCCSPTGLGHLPLELNGCGVQVLGSSASGGRPRCGLLGLPQLGHRNGERGQMADEHQSGRGRALAPAGPTAPGIARRRVSGHQRVYWAASRLASCSASRSSAPVSMNSCTNPWPFPIAGELATAQRSGTGLSGGRPGRTAAGTGWAGSAGTLAVPG
jgi:hypothetical protein